MYDLPMTLSFLLASEQSVFNAQDYLFAGELGLEGNLRPIRGVISFAILAKEKGIKTLVVPYKNEKEASLVGGVNIFAPHNLVEVIDFLESGQEAPSANGSQLFQPKADPPLAEEVDIAHISGQQTAKSALEIAAAGGHNIMMQGPPGSGKTILAKAFAGILPGMTEKEMIEVTKIYSVSGMLDPRNPLVSTRPFRAPHHSSSEPALIGGGPHLKPGEITLAHRGVLFLDEFPEFHRDVIESLRQPLESGFISVARAHGQANFPAKFILVAASNPCPCGFYNDPEKACRCFGSQLERYRKKLSGPIADRIDIHIEVPHQKYEVLTSGKIGEPSAKVRERIERAREIQKERFKNEKTLPVRQAGLCNSEMLIPQIKKYCAIPPQAEQFLQKSVDKDRLSARGYHKVLKLSRTIADLASREKINTDDVLSAIKYNSAKA
jgi:magnesium chelatase family protein